MYRSLLTISAVAALSCYIAHLEQAQGQLPATNSWVRTADGWEPSRVLQVGPLQTEPTKLHPLLVASFQLGASLFVLLAFPSRRPATKPSFSRVRVSKRLAGRSAWPTALTGTD